MERKLNLAVDKPAFTGLTWDSELRGFVLSWGADTEVANIVWERLITISFRWPPIRVYEAFTNREGE